MPLKISNNPNQNNDKTSLFYKKAGQQIKLEKALEALFFPVEKFGDCLLLSPERLVAKEGFASCSGHK